MHIVSILTNFCWRFCWPGSLATDLDLVSELEGLVHYNQVLYFQCSDEKSYRVYIPLNVINLQGVAHQKLFFLLQRCLKSDFYLIVSADYWENQWAMYSSRKLHFWRCFFLYTDSVQNASRLPYCIAFYRELQRCNNGKEIFNNIQLQYGICSNSRCYIIFSTKVEYPLSQC